MCICARVLTANRDYGRENAQSTTKTSFWSFVLVDWSTTCWILHLADAVVMNSFPTGMHHIISLANYCFFSYQ